MLTVACVHRPDEADQLVATFATSDDRRAGERFTRRHRRHQTLTSRALLRSVLAQAFGGPAESWELCYHADGKPAVRDKNGQEAVQISISHSRDVVACAITDIGPIGIDVECCAPERPFKKIAGATFGDAERYAVDKEGMGTFYKIWTLREALAKAADLELLPLAARNDLFAGAPAGEAWSRTVEQERWIFYYQEILTTYAFSVALKSASPNSGAELGDACAGLIPLICP